MLLQYMNESIRGACPREDVADEAVIVEKVLCY